jgi:hypothetical protein
VNGALKRRLALAVAVAALGAGGAVAAVAATAPSAHHRAGATRAMPADLPVAASYLGVSPAQLQTELRSGRTLAQIAAATPGKSEAGLIAALVSARQAKLAAIAAKLPEHVKAEVNRVPGEGAAAVVRAYLGLTQAQLHSELRAGRTLAQIADDTSGRSAAGLVAALLAARHQRLEAMVAAGKLTQAQLDARAATLQARITRLVNRVPHAHAPAG